MPEQKLLYRVTDQGVYHGHFGSSGKIIYKEFTVIRKTLKGVWVKDWKKERWVSNSGKKRFAYPTKAEALFAYTKRKEREILILNSRLNYVKRCLKTAKIKRKI